MTPREGILAATTQKNWYDDWNTLIIDGQPYCRAYNDSGDVPPLPEVERAFRDAYLAAAREVAKWGFPDLGAIKAAWTERRKARRRAEVRVTSAQYFNKPGAGRGKRIVYRPGHEVEAARTRGRVHAFEYAKRDWWDLGKLGLDDDEIREAFIKPWLDAVAAWAAKPLDACKPPPRPLYVFTAGQWRLVLSKQRGRERTFDCLESAEAYLRQRHGQYYTHWNCRDETWEVIGRVFYWGFPPYWECPVECVARLAARRGQRWIVFEERWLAKHVQRATEGRDDDAN